MIDFLTRSPHFYDYVVWGVLLLAAFNAFEVLFLLYNKREVERSEVRRLRLKRLASSALLTEAEPAALLPEPESDDDFSAYSEAVASVLDNFEGEIAEKARELLKDLGIAAHYRRLARHRAWYKRGNAADILASFKLPDNREFFAAAFRSETVADVRHRLIFGFSFLVRDGADLHRLAEMLAAAPHLTAKRTEDLFLNAITALRAAGKAGEFGGFMRAALHDAALPLPVKRDILGACHAAACENSRALLQDYYRAYPGEPEILSAALKALARIGDFTFIPGALKHPDWLVRMTALKNADLCCSEMVPEIRAMLRDTNYHVRMAAGLTLAKSGPKGLAALKEEAASEDGFAAATAAYSLTQVRA